MKNSNFYPLKGEKGFTLIELMIVVAIIGILAAIAIPAYQNYTIRARVAESASIWEAVKTEISIYISDRGQMPTLLSQLDNVSSVGTDYKGNYVSAITMRATDSAIVVSLKSIDQLGPAAAKSVTFIPLWSSGDPRVQWDIGGTVDEKFRPRI